MSAVELPAPVRLAAPQLLLLVMADGRRLGVQVAPGFGEGLGPQLKAAGAAWFAPRRMWVVAQPPPDGAASDGLGADRVADQVVAWLVGLVAGQPFDADDARRKVVAAVSTPERHYFTQLLDVQLFPLVAGGWALSALYDLPLLRALRALRGRFHKHATAWELRGPLPRILDAFLETAGVQDEYVFVHERPVVLEALVAPPPAEVTIQVPALPPEPRDAVVDEDEADGVDRSGTGFLSVIVQEAGPCAVDEAAFQTLCAAAKLRDYQETGVRHMAAQEGACLGDDMGLGKTRQTVVAAWLVAMGAAAGRAGSAEPGAGGVGTGDLVVTGLASARARTGRVLVLCPATLRTNWEREIHAVFAQHQVGIVGEDRLAMLYGCQWVVANYERLGGLVRELALHFDVLVIDEAHYLKEHDSGRTRNAFVMAGRIPRRYVVTGTPLLNREIELHTLLRLTGHRLGTLPLATFRKQFAGGAAQRAALAQALQGWMLRRRKDVLTDLGSKDRQIRYVSPAEGLAGYQALYQDMSLPAMPKIVKLRQALEALKVQFLVETVEGRSGGDKFIIFCEYKATVAALKAALKGIGVGCVSLLGSDSGVARQRAIDAFQGDAAVEVFIGTTSAAGVGITLTAANVVMFASLPWTPALMRQAEDRAYRLGQRRDVLVLVPLVEKTIDEQIWQLLASKAALEQDVVEAVRTDVAQGVSAPPTNAPWNPAGEEAEPPSWAATLLSVPEREAALA